MTRIRHGPLALIAVAAFALGTLGPPAHTVAAGVGIAAVKAPSATIAYAPAGLVGTTVSVLVGDKVAGNNGGGAIRAPIALDTSIGFSPAPAAYYEPVRLKSGMIEAIYWTRDAGPLEVAGSRRLTV